MHEADLEIVYEILVFLLYLKSQQSFSMTGMTVQQHMHIIVICTYNAKTEWQAQYTWHLLTRACEDVTYLPISFLPMLVKSVFKAITDVASATNWIKWFQSWDDTQLKVSSDFCVTLGDCQFHAVSSDAMPCIEWMECLIIALSELSTF